MDSLKIIIDNELKQYSLEHQVDLSAKPRWLVFNKCDAPRGTWKTLPASFAKDFSPEKIFCI